jgi:Right handed beta helix region/Protein of unknown function (DUF1565)
MLKPHRRIPRLLSLATVAVGGLGLLTSGSQAATPTHHATAKHHLVSVPAPHLDPMTTLPGVAPVLLTMPAPALYVSPKGDNTNSGTRPGAPLQTIRRALNRAQPGAVIHLAAGTYPQLREEDAYTNWITISGTGDATVPVIQGADLLGVQNLRFANVNFSSGLYLGPNPLHGQNQPAKNVQVLNSTIDCGSTGYAPTRIGVEERTGVQNLLLEGDTIQHCSVGFWSYSPDIVSSGTTIVNSTIQDIYGDGIDLGAQQNVTIAYDLIQDIDDPNNAQHDDGIQFYGNDANVSVVHNVIANSRSQLMLIGDTLSSRVTGSSAVENVLIAQNLMYGAGDYAVQVSGATNTQFVGNTIEGAGDGALLLRPSTTNGVQPSSVTVVGNILQTFGLYRTSTGPAVEGHNLIGGLIGNQQTGTGDIVGADPAFVDASDGNFSLNPLSPAAYSVTAQQLGADDPSAACSTVTSAPCSLGAIQMGQTTRDWGGRQTYTRGG